MRRAEDVMFLPAIPPFGQKVVVVVVGVGRRLEEDDDALRDLEVGVAKGVELFVLCVNTADEEEGRVDAICGSVFGVGEDSVVGRRGC